jgi:drug/metabolite transporter (DMT)-like permease
MRPGILRHQPLAASVNLSVISSLAFASIIASAFLHALWNAFARSRPEPGDALAAGVIASGIVSIPLLIYAGLPDRAAWPWLAFGIFINSVGIRIAMAVYRRTSYALAYPVMRAGIPLLAIPIAVLLFGEWPSLQAGTGVLLISAALIMLALIARRVGGAELRGVGLAVLASACGAGYVAADAMGVRLSGSTLSYAASIAVGNGLAIPLMLALEGQRPVAMFIRTARTGFIISVASMSSFLLYIWAVVETPVALAAALRETSVFFAMVIAALFMKDRIGPLHWAAASLAVLGVAAIRLA